MGVREGERRELKERFCVKYNEEVLIFLAFWRFGVGVW